MRKPDQDRAYDVRELARLLEVGVRTMESAVETSRTLEESMTRTRQILEEVPAQARTHRAEGTIDRLRGTLVKPEYESCIRLLKGNLPRLMEEVPAIDEKYAGQMRRITAETRALSSRIQELKSRVEGLGHASSVEGFYGALSAAASSWGEVELALGGLLKAMARFAKGEEKEGMASCGDPVDTATGNYVYDREDLCVPGRPPLSMKRFYNALDGQAGSLGKGWIHPYEIRVLQEREGGVTLLLEDGREEDFLREADGGWSCKYSPAALTGEGGGYRYESPDGSYRTFGEGGRCVESGDRQGNRLSFSYGEDGVLKEVDRGDGESLLFSYDGEGRLSGVEDHSGRKVSYRYEEGRLSCAISPGGGTVSYRYSGDGRLSSVTNAMGTETVRNTYDGKGRMGSQEFPDGSRMGYAYDVESRRTVFTDRNGSRTVYCHDEQLRHIRTIYEDGEERFGYNARNQRVLYQDKNGNRTRFSYDSRGNLTGVTDALGGRISLTYGEGNQPVSISVNGVQKLKAAYDRQGNLLSAMDALGRTRSFTYTEGNRMERILHPDGSHTQMSYDGRGNIIRIRNPYGAETQYCYDRLNRVTQVTDPSGNTTRYAYDEENRITRVTSGEGASRRYRYNAAGKLEEAEDFDGCRLACAYNSLNRPERLTDKEGNTTTLQYDSMWNICERRSGDGGVTRYRYDRMNRLAQVTDPLGRKTTYGYDPFGNPVEVVRPGGRKTRLAYDALNRIISAVEPDGAKTCYGYDGEGNLTKVTDACGHETLLEYDAAGQLVRRTDALGGTRSYTYTELGKVKTETDEAGRTTAWSYGPGGLPKQVRHPDGTVLWYTHDGAGHVTGIRDGGGYGIRYEYDSLGRMVQAEDSMGKRMTYGYDVLGRVTEAADGEGNRTVFRYSPGGNLERVEDALLNVTEYGYDPMGRLACIRRHGEGGEIQETRYERDLLGRPERIVDALGHGEQFRYDIAGNLAERTDREGNRTVCSYGAAGQLEEIRSGDGSSVSYAYNALRQLTEVRDSLGTTSFVLDALGRVLKATGPDGRSTGYGWGPSGERRSITYPDGRKVHYGYDESLRLSELREGDSVITYGYDGMGRLSAKALPNGVVTRYGYHPDGALRSLEHWGGEELLEGYRYGYDALGNPVETERSGQGMEGGMTWRYAYDALNRLTRVETDTERVGSDTRHYAYDAFGNRTVSRNGRTGEETLYEYNGLNQMLRSSGPEGNREYGYDLRGNLTEIREDGAVRNRYEYSAMNRLARAFGTDGTEAEYRYNGLGMRTGKVERGPGDAGAVKETAYALDLTRSFHNLLEKQEDTRTQSYLWDGNVAGAVDEGGRHYYCQDRLGSPVRYLDARGRTEESYRYDEFGVDLSGNQGGLQPFGYTGYQADRVSGTYFAQAREYLAEAGRFGAEDPVKGRMSHPGSMNPYSYCWNSPVGLVDLDGRYPMNPDMVKYDWYRRSYWIDYWKNVWRGLQECGKQGLQEMGDAISGAGDSIASGIGSAADAVRDVWNNYIYGEKVVTEVTTEVGSGFSGIYSKNTTVATQNNIKYKGNILIKTENISEDNYSVEYSLNFPSIDFGGGKSIGLPFSIGIAVGANGLDINCSNGIELIWLKGRSDIGVNILGDGIISISSGTVMGCLNQNAGHTASIPIRGSKSIKVGLLVEKEFNNITNSYEVGGHLKTGVVYSAAIAVYAGYLIFQGVDPNIAIEQLKIYWNNISSSCL